MTSGFGPDVEIDPNAVTTEIAASDLSQPVALNPTPVEIYGIASLAIASAFPLVWKLVLEGNTTLGTTGLKLASYFNMIGFGPYALGYLLYLLMGEDAASYIGIGLNWSLFGSWFLNFYAIYVTFYNGLASFDVTKLIIAAVYSGYSVGTLAMQVLLVPGVNAFVRGYNYNTGRLVYESPEQDRK